MHFLSLLHNTRQVVLCQIKAFKVATVGNFQFVLQQHLLAITSMVDYINSDLSTRLMLIQSVIVTDNYLKYKFELPKTMKTYKPFLPYLFFSVCSMFYVATFHYLVPRIDKL